MFRAQGYWLFVAFLCFVLMMSHMAEDHNVIAQTIYSACGLFACGFSIEAGMAKRRDY